MAWMTRHPKQPTQSESKTRIDTNWTRPEHFLMKVIFLYKTILLETQSQPKLKNDPIKTKSYWLDPDPTRNLTVWPICQV